MELLWTPLVGLGNFVFGSDIRDYFKLGITRDNFIGEEECFYRLEKESICIYLEDSKIDSIACYDKCIFKGKNLIGISTKAFLEIMNLSIENADGIDKIEIEDSLQDVLDFDQYGMQVWIKNGIVVTIFCSGATD